MKSLNFRQMKNRDNKWVKVAPVGRWDLANRSAPDPYSLGPKSQEH